MRGLLAAISRGVSWKLGADIVGRLLQYVLLLVAARSLGRAGFGDFTFALSTGYMFAQVADFGLQLYVQRELAVWLYRALLPRHILQTNVPPVV